MNSEKSLELAKFEKSLELLQRDLDIKEIEWMPGPVVPSKKNNKVYCMLIPYKNSTIDIDRLNEAFGADWKNDFRESEDKKTLLGGIGIFNPKLQEWIWRWNCGTPSPSEPTKGEHTDAIKRAGFMWGIGTELKTFKTVFIELLPGEYQNDPAGGKTKASNYFKPNTWNFTEVDGVLQIKDTKGNVRFNRRVRPDAS